MDYIIAVIITGVILCIFSVCINGSDFGSISLPAMFFGAVFITLGCIILEERGVPKAIDVYRGKTTIEITYRDSLPVDTVVVYKNECKK